MAANRGIDPVRTLAAVAAVADWLRDAHVAAPDRAALGFAVRATARTLASMAPGSAVEVRIPPFAAVQCVAGPRHTRGTPPNVVETDPRTWLLLATGMLSFAEAAAAGAMQVSGARAAEIAGLLPLVALPDGG
ncbi:MAG: sterol carrier family protein [Mycolicibacterium sp.]|uniref:sterol carrier family protein n=1 Tax=Mycolicibacterium sp. TaxID=2320850 RepID=UPI003D1362E2